MDWDEMHDVKGLANALKRSRGYVEDMKTCGFAMPGGRATVRMAMKFLTDHEDFSRGQAQAVRFARRKATGNKRELTGTPAR